MPATVLMVLGGYRFSLDSAAYQALQRSTEYRWPAQERLGRRPARQYVGVGDDEITLDGVIYPRFRGGYGQLDRMRSEAGSGTPLLMTDSTGRVQGQWVILRVEETQRVFSVGGSPEKVEFQLRLARYGEEASGSAPATPLPSEADVNAVSALSGLQQSDLDDLAKLSDVAGLAPQDLANLSGLRLSEQQLPVVSRLSSSELTRLAQLSSQELGSLPTSAPPSGLSGLINRLSSVELTTLSRIPSGTFGRLSTLSDPARQTLSRLSGDALRRVPVLSHLSAGQTSALSSISQVSLRRIQGLARLSPGELGRLSSEVRRLSSVVS